MTILLAFVLGGAVSFLGHPVGVHLTTSVAAAEDIALKKQLSTLQAAKRLADEQRDKAVANLEAMETRYKPLLDRLTGQITELINLLNLEKTRAKSLEDELASVHGKLATIKAENDKRSSDPRAGDDKDSRTASLAKELANKTSQSNEALTKVDLLNQQLLALRRQVVALDDALNAAESKDKESQARISDLGTRLNIVLARQVQELQRYRSDFFGRLNEVLRARKDIRVVGDRFVFQSGVLFAPGQATVTLEGLQAIDQLATAIVGLETLIPKDVNWVLQVDGHTDSRQVSASQFPSNWELSSSRATSVVKYLITRGVRPKRLIAAGHAEFQPLQDGTAEEIQRRNNRIELKLTTR